MTGMIFKELYVALLWLWKLQNFLHYCCYCSCCKNYTSRVMRTYEMMLLSRRTQNYCPIAEITREGYPTRNESGEEKQWLEQKKKKGTKEENRNDAYYNLISFSPGTDLLKWGQGSTPALPEFCDVEILMLHLAFWPLVWGLGWKAAKKHFGRPLCRTVADEV